MMAIELVEGGPLVSTVAQLFREYGSEWPGPDLAAEGFEDEIENLPGRYRRNRRGSLLLALVDDHAAGCIAIRRLDDQSAEIKRLFVRKHFRQYGLGRKLVEAALTEASLLGFKRVTLGTAPSMIAAQRLYVSLGFKLREALSDKDPAGSLIMERAL